MKDQASKGFDKLGKNAEKSMNKAGKAGQSAGGKISKGMKVGVAAAIGLGAQALKSAGDFGEVGDAALDAATAAATGFAVGGPVGAALAGGASLLSSWWEHEERIAAEAEAAKQALIEMAEASAGRITNLNDELQTATDRLRAVNAELRGEKFDQGALDDLRERVAAEEKIVQLRDLAEAALEKGTAEGEAAFDQLNAEADKLVEIQNVRRITVARERDIVRFREESAEALAREKEEAKEVLKWEKERAAELKKESDELDAIADKEAKLFDDLEGALERTTEQYEKQSEELGQHLALYRRLISEGFEVEAAELKKAVEAQKERKDLAAEQVKLEREVAREIDKQRKAQERFNERKEDAIRAVREEIELLDARNDEERQAIEDQREAADLREAGVSDRDIERLQSARRANEERADEAEREADAVERGTRSLSQRERAAGAGGGGGRGAQQSAGLQPGKGGSISGAVFNFGDPYAAQRKAALKKQVDETAAGEDIGDTGFRIASKDEQDADRRAMEREFGIERDDRGRKLGFEGDPLTRIGENDEKGFDVDGEFQSEADFEAATAELNEGAEQGKQAAEDLATAITDRAASDKEGVEALSTAAEEAGSAAEEAAANMDTAREAQEGATEETVKLAENVSKLADASTKGLEKVADVAGQAAKDVEDALERIAAVEAAMAEF